MAERTTAEARLAALGAHLGARAFDVELTVHGLRVTNPEAPGCCADSTRKRDMITCKRREHDGDRLWFFTSWGEPIAQADDITGAALFVQGYLRPRDVASVVVRP